MKNKVILAKIINLTMSLVTMILVTFFVSPSPVLATWVGPEEQPPGGNPRGFIQASPDQAQVADINIEGSSTIGGSIDVSGTGNFQNGLTIVNGEIGLGGESIANWGEICNYYPDLCGGGGESFWQEYEGSFMDSTYKGIYYNADSGRVGINTTPNFFGNLAVQGISLFYLNENYAGLSAIPTWTGDILFTGVRNFNGGTGDLIFRNGDIDGTVSEDRFIVKGDTGFVGIGTIEPTRQLHIVGSTNDIVGIRIENTLNSSDAPDARAQFCAFATGDYACLTKRGAYNPETYGGPNAMLLWNNSNAPIVFYTNQTEKMRLTAEGDLSVGSATPFTFTNNAAVKMTVKEENLGSTNSIGATITMIQTSPQTSAGSSASVVLAESNSNYWGLVKATSGNDATIANNFAIGYGNGTILSKFLTITPTGNVGIGTQTPSNKMQVSGDVRLGLVTEDNGSQSGYGSRLYFSGGDDWSSWDSDNSDPLWIARYNTTDNNTDLVVNIGDDASSNDRLVIGNTLQTTGAWRDLFSFDTNGSMAIGPEALISGSNSIVKGTGISVTGNDSIGIRLGHITKDLAILDQNNVVALLDGKLGIGTTAPTKALEVVGDILASGTICDSNGCIGSSGTTELWATSGTGIYNTNAGGVGIGTKGTPGAEFQVYTNSNAGEKTYLNSAIQEGFLVNSYWNTSDYNYGVVDLVAGRYTNSASGGSKFRFFTQPRTGSTGAVPPALRMVIDKDGNVGINTASPSNKLDVVGFIEANGSDTVTSNPPTVDQNTGWKVGLWGNNYALGVAGYTMALKTGNWISLFTGNPAGNGTASAFDTNAFAALSPNFNYLAGKVGIGVTDPSVNVKVNVNASNMGGVYSNINLSGGTGFSAVYGKATGASATDIPVGVYGKRSGGSNGAGGLFEGGLIADKICFGTLGSIDCKSTWVGLGGGTDLAGWSFADDYLYDDGEAVIRATDEWLRLNQSADGSSAFTNGVYTPGLFRADGGFNIDNRQVVSSDGTRFYPYNNVNGDYSQGIFWNGDSTAYAIYREPGDWTTPYPDLRIAFNTGIKLGAASTYGGIRFYNNYDMATMIMSVNDSATAGANNVYIANKLGVGKTSPAATLDVAGSASLGGVVTLGSGANADYVLIKRQNSTAEGGELRLEDYGASTAWTIDNYQNNLRFYGGGQRTVQIGGIPAYGIYNDLDVGGSDLYVKDQAGLVGIGTNNPTNKLHVIASASDTVGAIYAEVNRSGYGAAVTAYDKSGQTGGTAISAQSTAGRAIFAQSSTGFAGDFSGNVRISGDLDVGLKTIFFGACDDSISGALVGGDIVCDQWNVYENGILATSRGSITSGTVDDTYGGLRDTDTCNSVDIYCPEGYMAISGGGSCQNDGVWKSSRPLGTETRAWRIDCGNECYRYTDLTVTCMKVQQYL